MQVYFCIILYVKDSLSYVKDSLQLVNLFCSQTQLPWSGDGMEEVELLLHAPTRSTIVTAVSLWALDGITSDTQAVSLW